MPLIDNAALLSAVASVGSAAAGHFILLWMLLGGIGFLVLHPFKRRIGGIDPKTGRPGGSEPAFVGTVWVLAAVVTGIYMAH